MWNQANLTHLSQFNFAEDLPSYSPNLNLIERLWKLVKAECLHGRYYPSFKPFKEAIVTALERTDPTFQQKLQSLLTLKFQLFDTAA